MTSDQTVSVCSRMFFCEMLKQESSPMLPQFAYMPKCSFWCESYELGTQVDPTGRGFCVIVIVSKEAKSIYDWKLNHFTQYYYLLKYNSFGSQFNTKYNILLSSYN